MNNNHIYKSLMCNFNPKCSAPDGYCRCMSDQSQDHFYNLLNFSQLQSLNINLLSSLYQAVTMQGELISKLNDNLTGLREALPSINSQKNESTTPTMLIEFLYSENYNFSHSIRLLTAPPSPVYKERAFSFSVEIIDQSEEISRIDQTLILELKLFTSENPPKQVEFNTSGVKALKFICDLNGQSLFCFRKIFISEVTSHYRNGALMLVVTSNVNSLKPLIIEDFIVKARKIPSKSCKEPNKKLKQK